MNFPRRQVLALGALFGSWLLGAGDSSAAGAPPIYASGTSTETFDGSRSKDEGRKTLPEKLTLAAHVRVARSGRWNHLVEVGAKEHGWGAGLRLAVGSEGEWSVSIGDGHKYRDVNAKGSWRYGQWTFVALTYDGKRLVLFENGKQVTSFEANKRIAGGSGTLFLGSMYGKKRFFRGELRDVRLYDRVLSKAELTEVGRGGGSTAQSVSAAPSGPKMLAEAPFPVARGKRIVGASEVRTPGAYTYGFWIRPTGTEKGWSSVLHKGTSNAERGPAIFFYPGSTRLQIRSSSAKSYNEGFDPERALPIGRWTHVAVAAGRGRLRVYFDGALVGDTAIAKLKPNSGPLWAGNPWAPAAPARLARITFAPRALDVEAIKKLAAARPG